jgi:hypothetical protein
MFTKVVEENLLYIFAKDPMSWIANCKKLDQEKHHVFDKKNLSKTWCLGKILTTWLSGPKLAQELRHTISQQMQKIPSKKRICSTFLFSIKIYDFFIFGDLISIQRGKKSKGHNF